MVHRRPFVLILIGILLFTAFYTTISGLWGVLVTDLFQFVLKMGMVILLAILAVNAVGGIDALEDESRGARRRQRASRFAARLLSAARFGVDAADHAVRLSGRELVGELVSGRRTGRRRLRRPANFLGQERAARRVGHALVQRRPLRAAALAVDSHGAGVDRALSRPGRTRKSGYIKTLMDPAIFPPSLRGFMIAAFAAAYMSTIGTQLNWGASYVINDFYRRFVVRDGRRAALCRRLAGRHRAVDDRVAGRHLLPGLDRVAPGSC